MNIVIADDLAGAAVELLRREGWDVDARSGRSPEELARALATADALIVRSATRVDGATLAAAPRLRVVARAGTGVDNVDVDAATARGVLVLNAAGANSVSVAEHACALLLALARSIPAADASMKQGRWEKSRLTGAELQGKVLGLVGLGRVGQEVARRAQAFDMHVIAHDPFIPPQIAADLGATLVSLDDLCARSDYISLHLPSTPATRHLFDRARLALCKAGAHLVNTARGDLIDQDALVEAIQAGHVGGAGLDVFEQEPPLDWRLAALPRVIATPHIAGSTREAQELVGLETATSVRDFLRSGLVRNAVNFPPISAEEFRRLRPFLTVAERLGSVLAALANGPIDAVGVRYYGELAGTSANEPIVGAALVGLLAPILGSGITPVNALKLAAERGIDVVESRSSRPRNFTSLLSLKVRAEGNERWAEGTVFEHGSPRLVLLDSVPVEAPLDGTLLVVHNDDQPGVIGAVGTILGRHRVNIANFALGRGQAGAVGVVNVDEGSDAGGPRLNEAILDEIRAVPAVREVAVARVT